MTVDEFVAGPVEAVAGRALQALWQMAHGEWKAAHALVDDATDRDGMWVHAHLHRVEGDAENAAYWYRRAGKAVSGESLEAERGAITATLLRALA